MNKIVFKSPMAKILIPVIFLNFGNLFNSSVFYCFLSTKLPWHTGPFVSHQCAAAHRLKIDDLDYSGSKCRLSERIWRDAVVF
jgi:hypothetical protein